MIKVYDFMGVLMGHSCVNIVAIDDIAEKKNYRKVFYGEVKNFSEDSQHLLDSLGYRVVEVHNQIDYDYDTVLFVIISNDVIE